ncbi:MAG: hypothetical protein L0220_06655 [Acidobacteria bacterium]|nr:hypothetical protein [Acidobacteriota bacterium]
MIGERYFNGREMTQDEIETMLRIIREVNIEVAIENGQVLIEAQGEDSQMHTIARWDIRRMAAHSGSVIKQVEGDHGVFALSGLFAKCAQIVLNEAEPSYEVQRESESLGGAVRVFAGDETENTEE